MSRNTQKENPARVSLAPASLPLALVPPETGAGFRMPWLRRAHISQHMAKDPHEEGTVPPPACVLLQGLVALGLFVVALLLVWGVCHWFFFPRLETKKTQEGEKMRKKKKIIQAWYAQHFQNTGLPQHPSNSTLVVFIPFCIPGLSPFIISCSSTNPCPCSCFVSTQGWEQAGAAGPCCVLSSCCTRIP